MDDDPRSNACVTSRLRRYRVDAAKIEKLAQLVCSKLGIANLDLNIELVSAMRIRKLNKTFRGINSATDVLSFPQQTWQKPLKASNRNARSKDIARSATPKPLGDIVISLPIAEMNARKIGQNLDQEVCFLLVHGVLHLCGHDHQTRRQEEAMLKEQRKLMSFLGKTAEAPLWVSCVKARKVGRR